MNYFENVSRKIKKKIRTSHADGNKFNRASIFSHFFVLNFLQVLLYYLCQVAGVQKTWTRCEECNDYCNLFDLKFKTVAD